MADHDRDAGSRGDEEAPRGPSPDQPALKYGEQADQAYAEIPPTQPVDRETPRSGGRRGRKMLIGAGLVGLLAGALIGGVSVAAVNDADHDHDHGRLDVWYDLPRRDGFRMHVEPDMSCWFGEADCEEAPSPPRVPRPPRPDDAPAAPVAPAYDD